MKISQHEALRLRKRVDELEQRERERFNRWATNFPGGTNFHTFAVDKESAATIRTARLLGHAVVVTIDTSDRLLFYALPPRASSGQ